MFTADHYCQIFVGKNWGGQPPKKQSNICPLRMWCLQQSTIAKFLWAKIVEAPLKKQSNTAHSKCDVLQQTTLAKFFVGKNWGGQPPKKQSNICPLKMWCLQQTTIAKLLWVEIGEDNPPKKNRLTFAHSKWDVYSRQLLPNFLGKNWGGRPLKNRVTFAH